MALPAQQASPPYIGRLVADNPANFRTGVRTRILRRGTNRSSGDRFGVLDGWRGVCALLVATTHFPANSHIFTDGFIRGCGFFVDFFFVLSGFVIAYAYRDRLYSVADLRNFMIRRFGRLWPLHASILMAFVTMTLVRSITVGPSAFSGNHDAPSIITNLFLIQSLGIHSDETWNSPSWSISVEFWTYVVFGICCVVLARARRFLPLLGLGVAAFGAVMVLVFANGNIETAHDFGFFRCLYGFFAGYLAFCLWERFRGDPRIVGALEIAIVPVIYLFVRFAHGSVVSMLAPFAFAAAVWIFAHEAGPISRIGQTRFVRMLGTWSYSIYMVHALIIHLILRALRSTPFLREMDFAGLMPVPATVIDLGNQWAGDAATITYLGLVLVVSCVTYRLIEAPGRSYFNRLAGRDRPVAVPA